MCSYLDQFEVILINFELFGAIWRHFELFGAIRSYLELFGPFPTFVNFPMFPTFPYFSYISCLVWVRAFQKHITLRVKSHHISPLIQAPLPPSPPIAPPPLWV